MKDVDRRRDTEDDRDGPNGDDRKGPHEPENLQAES